jgi:ABC-type glycerol-3-phosphate transport system substrate-binding protein
MSQASETARCWTLTFYAYKGGTGRTLALINVARYMAEELGYRIGLVDLDLESPGLSHEPLCPQLDAGAPGRTKLIREINRHLGFVDLFNSRFAAWEQASAAEHMAETSPPASAPRTSASSTTLAAPAAALTMPEITDEDVDRHVIRLDSGGDGTIVLMPTAKVADDAWPDAAGDGPEPESWSYPANLEVFLRRLSLRSPAEVAGLTQAVLQTFIRRYDLDFLFLDGRTGTGSFFSVYTYSVPQLLVLFCGLNEQNIKGSLSVLQAKAYNPPDNFQEAPVLLIASPVPTVGPRMLEARLASVMDELRELERERVNAVSKSKKGTPKYIYELPQGVEFMLPYTDLASYEETYFLRRYPHSQLAREYRRLATAIETLTVKPGGLPDRLPQGGAARAKSAGKTASQRGAPLRIAAENVTEDHFRSFFRERGYAEKEIVCGDGGAKLSVRSDSAPPYDVELWPSEHTESPWEMLAHGRDLSNPPDVLLFPQIHLGSLTSGSKLLDLTEERLAADDRDSTKRPRIFKYSFLDRFYPGWRHWCSFGAHVMSLPFSINTMLLCANRDLLREVCLPYWQARGQVRRDPGLSFLPSSWPTLVEVLRQFNALASTNRDWQPFRMVLHDRGLYYEWLNIVLAMGGVDLHEREGRLLERISVAAPRVVEATEVFRDLAANTVRQKSPRMDQQIAAFGQGLLALYVAWTDSFRFAQPARVAPRRGDTSPIKTTIADVPGLPSPLPAIKIQLGSLPRDVRYPRRQVVDGWLMAFPAGIKAGRKRHAFEFASAFLDPELQWRLLRRGFPTPSLWAVDQELASHAERPVVNGQPPLGERNYDVFLRALRAAITDGHWVPSPVKGTEIYDKIRAALYQILRGDGVKEKLDEAQTEIWKMLTQAGPMANAAPVISEGGGYEA